ncbi:hypothetical protein WICPIJ_001761 [Wickerhamomyces pijperi]|uniref:Pore and endoplasmic reticulum protein of 33 kDa n=1 Tax=Wickerhamomyces pijperi TaxID=599730 RepID=A0A9P8TQE9_WICPI|nr:hypothetical protein WICPIJ_001761 [Wickerhamomyces pijperi]
MSSNSRNTNTTPRTNASANTNTNSSNSVATSTDFNTFLQLLKPRLTTPQFFWFVGHVSTLLNSAIYLFFSFFSTGISQRYYKYALMSIISTYLIVLYQVYKSSNAFSFFNLKNFTNNDNFQYLALALLWYLVSGYKVIGGGLYPFIIYSTFHVLNYFKNFILPILPSMTPQQKTLVQNYINHFVRTYNEQSLVASANLEVLVLVQLAIGSPLVLYYLLTNFWLAIINIIVIVQFVAFMKLRYRQSKYTKGTFDGTVYKLDAFMNSGTVPLQFVQTYANLKLQVTQLIARIPF